MLPGKKQHRYDDKDHIISESPQDVKNLEFKITWGQAAIIIGLLCMFYIFMKLTHPELIA
jgi:hypothetical protein